MMKNQRGKRMLPAVLAGFLFITLWTVVSPSAAAVEAIRVEGWSQGINGDAETLELPAPAGTKVGELLVAQIAYEKGLDAKPIMSPVGWTLIASTDAYVGGGDKDIGQALYWKVMTASEPATYVWKFSQTVKALGGITRIMGAHATNPVLAVAGQGGYGSSTGENAMIAPAVDAVAGARLIGFYALKELAVLEVPLGMDRVYQVWDVDNDYSILAADEWTGRADSTGMRTAFSWKYEDIRESIESEWVSQLLALRPSSSVPVSAANVIRIYIDRQAFEPVEKPFIESGRTLVPMRAFFEALGAEVDWDGVNRVAIGVRGNVTIRIPIGSTQPTVSGEVVPIEVAARIINQRTFIPLRFVGEALGELVDWDGPTRTITISTGE